MENVKHRIIFFWMTHLFLRRIAKRYPDYFTQWVKDITDDNTKREIMRLRYLGDQPLKFEAIAIKMNIPIRRVFEKHKSVVNRMIGGV